MRTPPGGTTPQCHRHAWPVQVPCTPQSLADASWLAKVPPELVAARYLHFLLYEGAKCNIKEHLETWRTRPRDDHSDREVQWHVPLLAVLTVRHPSHPYMAKCAAAGCR
jgi:hypothetical protein